MPGGDGPPGSGTPGDPSRPIAPTGRGEGAPSVDGGLRRSEGALGAAERAEPVPVKGTSAAGITVGQMRGSSLLLVGRFISLGLNFVVQVLIARYLTESDYGAWAFALSLVLLGETVTGLGLDRGVGRFLAVYDEQKDYARMAGALLLVAGVVLSIGLTLVLVVTGARSWIGDTAIGSAQATSLLVILVALSPIQAADNLLASVLAVFASAKAIFLRRFVVAPLLKLSVVLLLVFTSQEVQFLAAGYVVVGGVGLLLYAGILWRVLGDRGVRAHLRFRSATVPFRAILGFTLPLLSTDLVYVSIATTDALLLQHYWGAVEVAQFRVVMPLANLNLVVYTSFTLLFTPAASRLFARQDRQGVADLYWKTAVWVAVFSFPMFAITTTLARPVTELLYEPRYAASAVFLTIVSVGYYANAAFGFNGLTLRVYGFLRYTLVTNLVTVAANIGLHLALIPRMGALGAAVATAATLILHNAIKQWGLHRGTGVSVFDWRYGRVYVVVVGAITVLGLVQWLLDPPLVVGVVLAAVASLVVLVANRRLLDVAATFPELLRVPGARRLLRP